MPIKVLISGNHQEEDRPPCDELSTRPSGPGLAMDAKTQPPGGLEPRTHHRVESPVPRHLPTVRGSEMVPCLSGSVLRAPRVPRPQRGALTRVAPRRSRPIGCMTAQSTSSPALTIPEAVSSPCRQPERLAMERYIGESLATGLIHPSSSPAGAKFFLWGKRKEASTPASTTAD